MTEQEVYDALLADLRTGKPDWSEADRKALAAHGAQVAGQTDERRAKFLTFYRERLAALRDGPNVP